MIRRFGVGRGDALRPERDALRPERDACLVVVLVVHISRGPAAVSRWNHRAAVGGLFGPAAAAAGAAAGAVGGVVGPTLKRKFDESRNIPQAHNPPLPPLPLANPGYGQAQTPPPPPPPPQANAGYAGAPRDRRVQDLLGIMMNSGGGAGVPGVDGLMFNCRTTRLPRNRIRAMNSNGEQWFYGLAESNQEMDCVGGRHAISSRGDGALCVHYHIFPEAHNPWLLLSSRRNNSGNRFGRPSTETECALGRGLGGPREVPFSELFTGNPVDFGGGVGTPRHGGTVGEVLRELQELLIRSDELCRNY